MVDVGFVWATVCVKEVDRVVASVAGEMPVVAVDHGQAGAHVTGEIEGRDAGTERERGEGVPQIVDAPQRCDPGRELGGLPLARAEVVQIEVGTTNGREQEVRVSTR